MRIIITGSPGTGKSAVAKALAQRLSLPLVDIKKIVLEKGLRGKGHEVDLKKLARALRFLSRKKDYVVEGHLACEIPLPADFVFVLRTDPKTLKKRLAARRYGKKKLEENLLSEMLDYCVQRAEAEYGKPPLELETSRRSVAICAKEIEKAVKQRKKRIDSVDYSQQLKAHLGLKWKSRRRS